MDTIETPTHSQPMQVLINPPNLIETGITVETQDNLRFFKFTEPLQNRLEELLDKNATTTLTEDEQTELDAIGELDRLFTYLNSLLIANHAPQ
ncbi:hypothetical protein PN441_09975 [Spirulina major CS-329]|jgi:hypothetical protein|uniref:hypothetical protein n=1 Tax=Spirulina TaxID=1154 RepID=UPI002330F1B0|nr:MULTISPECIES: hypothetical protein [Spirulina]MDB9494726.1 hypothetical protein [Spirulina subsalsa CS-330]MDB9503398.1 hypothetical protein [Spirulina major CS-329]